MDYAKLSKATLARPLAITNKAANTKLGESTNRGDVLRCRFKWRFAILIVIGRFDYLISRVASFIRPYVIAFYM